MPPPLPATKIRKNSRMASILETYLCRFTKVKLKSYNSNIFLFFLFSFFLQTFYRNVRTSKKSEVLYRVSQWRHLIPVSLNRMGQKLLNMGFRKWAPPKQVFAVSSENTDFPKKLLNMKIFSIKFMTKEVILIFGVRWFFFLKNAHVCPKCFKLACNNFWHTLYIYHIIIYVSDAN